MITQKFYLQEYSWEVFVYYNAGYKDLDEILNKLRTVGVAKYDYYTAQDNLVSR